MQSIPTTAEESATPSVFRMKPRVLSAILKGFASKDKHRGALTSIIFGAKGWFASNTHRIVWCGEPPTPEEAKTTDPRSIHLEIARARLWDQDCDLANAQLSDKTSPNVRRVLNHDLYPVFDLKPEQLAEIARLAAAVGAVRVTVCSRAEYSQTDETVGGSRPVGFVIKPEEGDYLYCLAMSCSADGIRPAIKVDTVLQVPAIEGLPLEPSQPVAA